MWVVRLWIYVYQKSWAIRLLILVQQSEAFKWEYRIMGMRSEPISGEIVSNDYFMTYQDWICCKKHDSICHSVCVQRYSANLRFELFVLQNLYHL